jgi:hypothetical protein
MKAVFNILIRYQKTTILILIVTAISLFETNSFLVEHYYYEICYPKISFVQRGITAWIPFSIGDVLYVALVFYICYFFYIHLKKIIQQKQQRWLIVKQVCLKCFHFFLIVYVAFKLLWGLNYSRQGIAKQLNLQQDTYCKEELVELIEDLIFEANHYRKQIADTALPNIDVKTVFNDVEYAYKLATIFHSQFRIQQFAIKPSLFSPAGNYLGYTGYYNPFTGEAQVRDDIPLILLPFIACHEVAHQLGYASEEQANFVAYLVASYSNNIYIKYSTCLELLDYALNDLFLKYYEDFDTINGFKKRFQLEDCFDPQVKKDRKTIKLFFLQNKKEMSNISNYFYDKYLKINYQNAGIISYNEVIGLLLAYRYKKSLIR